MKSFSKTVALVAIAITGLALSACVPRYYDGYYDRYGYSHGYRDRYYDNGYRDRYYDNGYRDRYDDPTYRSRDYDESRPYYRNRY
jgi:hypothetical protein